MCNLKKLFEEIPSWLTNILVIGLMVILVLILIFLPDSFGVQDRAELIVPLCILLGTLVVGNSITQLRSKTVENELMRSSVDIINHCITNKKLKIETYTAAVIANIHASNADKLDPNEINKAREEADKALKKYNKYCEDLKNMNKEDEGDIIDKILKVALERLKDLVKPKNQKSKDRVSLMKKEEALLAYFIGAAGGLVSGFIVSAAELLVGHGVPFSEGVLVVFVVAVFMFFVGLLLVWLIVRRDP